MVIETDFLTGSDCWNVPVFRVELSNVCEGYPHVMSWNWIYPYLNETLGLDLKPTQYRDTWDYIEDSELNG